MNKLLFYLIFGLFLIGSISANGGIGGTITIDGEYYVHTFTSNGTFNWTGIDNNITFLMIGGGGAGGGNLAGLSGGGGAGGYIYNNSANITAAAYTIKIGTGGVNSSGINSSFNFTTLQAGGGGLGGYYSSSDGFSGGSGGGGGETGIGGSGQGAAGILNQGNSGGNFAAPNGGGGGGSGSVGGNSSGGVGGAGGTGTSNSINGTAFTWACGGGGGAASGNVAGAGGCTYGGAGGLQGTSGGVNATNGTGSGGGGGGGGSAYVGGNGGNGVVIIRYKNQSTAAGVTLLNPTNTQPLFNNSFTFSTIAIDSDNATNLNITIYTNATGGWTINGTNSSAYNNTQTNFSRVFPNGVYLWNALVNDGITSSFATSNFTFIITNSTVNSITWNISTAETANESFSALITSNGSVITNGYLNYNGTISSTTITNTVGNNYTLTKYFDIPLGHTGQNRTFNFTYTLAGINYTTANNAQNVSLAYFVACNATYTNDFLNITFKDEITGVYLNASVPESTFVYYLGSGLVNKTLSYSNSSNQYYYTFCATPTTSIFNVLPNVQYKQNSTYPQRIYESIVQLYNSSVFEQVLYLLNSADGIFVTFQLINSAEQSISGVDVNVTRTSDGTLISSGSTDAAGLVTFFLNPDVQHTIGFSKTGYDTFITTLFPTQTAYTIVLGQASDTSNDYSTGIVKSVSPTNDFLDEGTTYNFTYSINSSFWTLDSFSFYLYYGNGTLIGSNTSTVNGGTLYLFNVNGSNQSYIYMNYSYVINGSYSNFSRTWIVQSTTGRGYSIWYFFTDLILQTDSATGLYGLTDFGKTLLSFLAIVLVVGLLGNRYGIANEATLSGVIFGLVYLFDVSLNWIPRVQFGNIQAFEHFPTVLVFIIMIVLIIREER